jgi:transposase-like protein
MGDTKVEGNAPSSAIWEQLEPFVRAKVQELIQQLLEQEITEHLGRQRYERRSDDESGYRNGYGKPRKLAMQGGTITVRRPRLRELDDDFVSRVLPLFARHTREVGVMLPELYLHGLALGDFELAIRGLLGDAAPLSPSSIDRLRSSWQREFDAWRARRLDERELVYVWADGIYVKAGLEKEKAALLVIVGAMKDGTKEVLSVTPGFRESTESWLQVLRDLRDRGLRPPKLVVADGAAGIWAAVDQVWPEAEAQRCWNHKMVNVLDRLPKPVQREAKKLLGSIPVAATKAQALKLREAFRDRFSARYPDAVTTLERDWDRMVTFYDYPMEHWKHLRTTNVVESPFATVRLRTDAAKRYQKTANATAMIWKLLMVAEQRFRGLGGQIELAEVYEGVRFADGKKVMWKQAAA